MQFPLHARFVFPIIAQPVLDFNLQAGKTAGTGKRLPSSEKGYTTPLIFSGRRVTIGKKEGA